MKAKLAKKEKVVGTEDKAGENPEAYFEVEESDFKTEKEAYVEVKESDFKIEKEDYIEIGEDFELRKDFETGAFPELFELAGPKAKELIEKDCEVMSACETRPYPLVVDRAKGSVVTGLDGKEYIDFVAGIAVLNAGHSNPAVNAAISAQLEKMTHCCSADFFAEPPLKLAEKLRELSGYSKVFYCNSGTEAVEAAIKLAFWKTRRQGLVGFYNGFHGRTLGSLSLTCSKLEQKARFPALRTAHTHYAYCYRCPLSLEYPSCGIECAKLLENLIFRKELSPEDTAAVVVEPIQGEGGYIVPPPEFHAEIRKICTDHDVLLVADEVQAACFRTGPFLAMENFGVRPDISCLAKALGSGLPMGAMLADSSLMDWPPGVHANTFGGNLLASAGALAALEFLEKEKMGERAKVLGNRIQARLRELQESYPCIGDVRGLGLMVGAEIVKPDKSIDPGLRDRIVREGFKQGLMLLGCGESVIRFSPPLVLTDEEAELGMEKFEAALKMAVR